MAKLSIPDHAPGGNRPQLGRRVLPRLALLLAAPILFFCALEWSLRLAGFGKSTDFFIPDETPGFFRTNPNFTAPFIPGSFGIQPLNFRIRRHKNPNTIRIFVLGESAAQGIPDPDFGFASQLAAQLKARYPKVSFEVLNLGITAIDSHVVYRIVRQVADFEPDLFVIYMGNNEVVGPYGPGCAYMSTTPPVWLIRASVAARSTRTGQLVERLLARVFTAGAKARDWKGMETFSNNSVRGDDPRLDDVYRNFSSNLQGILDLAGAAGTKTVLATVVANLKDSAPFISLHRAGLSEAEAKSWKAAWEAGRIAWDLGDAASAKFQYEESVRIDPQYAEAHFRLGRLAEALGDTPLARKQYLEALHWDALRFRPDTRLNEIIRRAAKGAGAAVELADAARTLGSDPDSAAPLSGRETQFDHVHFNWAGNFQMARLLGDACARALPLPPAAAVAPLGSAGCATALGYTPEAQLKVLQVIVQLMLRPPFTNQFTFSGDQARLKKEIGAATAALSAPGARSEYVDIVNRSLRLDPESAPLAARLGDMEFEAGDPGRALPLLEKAESLEPPSVDLSMRKAEVLMRLRRFDEAEALLLETLKLDEVYFAPSRTLVELWTESNQVEKGKAFFIRELGRRPTNSYLRLEYANLLARGGDQQGAEREARRTWDEDRGSRPAMAALELLVRLYEREGRAKDADMLSLGAFTYQPQDFFNNRRLVRIYAQKGDAVGVAESLQAVEASGPFDSAEHLDLAHRLSDLNRGPEMLDELAEAREVAQVENNPGQLQSVNAMIAAYRQRFSEGQAK